MWVGNIEGICKGFSCLERISLIRATVQMIDNQDLEVEEETGDDEAYVPYDIHAYPSDLTLKGIHEMWHSGDLIVPEFQRNFVWTIAQSSLLIESFLMGLPVPQMFLYVDDDNRSLVIDGLQRMMSIVFFMDGYFGDETIQGRKQVFRLTGLSERSPFHRKTFSELDDSNQRKLRGSVLRAINIRQIKPQGENTSVYHIFERLNTGGTPLKPQEIRNVVFRGNFVDILRDVNKDKNWRKLIGKSTFDRHQKDVELVLRVFSLAYGRQKYEKPMKEFLNNMMNDNKSGGTAAALEFPGTFKQACEVAVTRLPEKPFHLRGGRLNVSALDSVLVTILTNPAKLKADLGEAYKSLRDDKKFEEATYYGTSDVAVIKQRFEAAERHLIG